MSGPWFHRFKSNTPPPTAGDGLPQLHSSDQAPSALPTEAEVSLLVNRKEELDGGSLEKCSSRMKASFVSHSEIKDLEYSGEKITRRGESTRLYQIKCQVSPVCRGLGSDSG